MGFEGRPSALHKLRGYSASRETRGVSPSIIESRPVVTEWTEWPQANPEPKVPLSEEPGKDPVASYSVGERSQGPLELGLEAEVFILQRGTERNRHTKGLL